MLRRPGFCDGRGLWHKKGVTGSRQARRPRPPLTAERLEELALAYVGRFATTRMKLVAYLGRKVRERGWEGAREPDVEAIAERFASRGYIDDAGYALARSSALSSRGYGPRRVGQSLRAAGISDEDGEAARELAASRSVEAAVRFAERRRIGPFGSGSSDPKARERALAAMIRAGHGFALARAIVDLPPGAPLDGLSGESN